MLELENLRVYYNCPRTFQGEAVPKGGGLEAQPTCETWKTDTLICVLAVGVTSASVQAGLGHVAQVGLRVLAFLPRESRGTLAGWFSYQGCSFTGSPVLAGVAFTGVSVLAVVSKKAFSTPATEKK